MKILLSSSTIDRRNGYGNITYELSRTLAEKGIDVTLLLPRDYALPLPKVKGVSIRTILPKYLFQALRPELLRYFTWSFDTKGETYDLVHSIFEVPYAPLMAREASRLGIPFMMGAQGTYGVKPLEDFPERFFLMYAYNAASAIHVPSMYTRDAIIRHARKKYDITIIHNGVDFERFARADGDTNAIRKQHIGKKILLTVGELKSRKGQDIVIRAMPQVLKKHPNTIYLVVGNDGWNGYLQNLAREIGVAEHVVFVGPISNDIVPEYFHACDVYVHTARIAGKYFFEGFGIVYLEAAACGKPSVGTDAGGITDALLHEKTGFVAQNENYEEVADYINRLLDDPVLSKRMGENAREYARLHTWDQITDRYIGLYGEALRKHGPTLKELV